MKNKKRLNTKTTSIFFVSKEKEPLLSKKNLEFIQKFMPSKLSQVNIGDKIHKLMNINSLIKLSIISFGTLSERSLVTFSSAFLKK